MFTNAAQVYHVMQVAEEAGLTNPLRAALRRCVVCSVGCPLLNIPYMLCALRLRARD